MKILINQGLAAPRSEGFTQFWPPLPPATVPQEAKFGLYLLQFLDVMSRAQTRLLSQSECGLSACIDVHPNASEFSQSCKYLRKRRADSFDPLLSLVSAIRRCSADTIGCPTSSRIPPRVEGRLA